MRKVNARMLGRSLSSLNSDGRELSLKQLRFVDDNSFGWRFRGKNLAAGGVSMSVHKKKIES